MNSTATLNGFERGPEETKPENTPIPLECPYIFPNPTPEGERENPYLDASFYGYRHPQPALPAQAPEDDHITRYWFYKLSRKRFDAYGELLSELREGIKYLQQCESEDGIDGAIEFLNENHYRTSALFKELDWALRDFYTLWKNGRPGEDKFLPWNPTWDSVGGCQWN